MSAGGAAPEDLAVRPGAGMMHACLIDAVHQALDRCDAYSPSAASSDI